MDLYSFVIDKFDEDDFDESTDEKVGICNWYPSQ